MVWSSKLKFNDPCMLHVTCMLHVCFMLLVRFMFVSSMLQSFLKFALLQERFKYASSMMPKVYFNFQFAFGMLQLCFKNASIM